MSTPTKSNLNPFPSSRGRGHTTPNRRPLATQPSFIPRRAADPPRSVSQSMLRNIDTATLTGNTMNTSNGLAIFNLVFPESSSEGRLSMDVPLVSRGGNSNIQSRGVRNVESDAEEDPRADYEIYYNQLLAKKRGSPVWVPGPGMQLPIAYRRRGVSIGDVGLIYCSGGFDFLFNIFLPADHSIHWGGVPEGFYPLNFAEIQNDIEKTIIYGPNSYLASSTLRKTSGINSDGLMFETSAREAAVLVMPDGALTQNLLNLESVRGYIAANVSQWYKYAIRKRGRTIGNGDIRIVVGCDMASSWGIATLAGGIEQAAQVRLEFRGRGYGAASGAHSWECIGTNGHGRVGPQEAELLDLRQENRATPLQNQCVFVRTINLTLSGETWSRTAVHNHVWSGRDTPSGSLDDSSLGGSSNIQPRKATRRSQPSHLPGNLNSMQLGASDTHPSTSLNKFLLEKHPKAKMAITQDADWISAMKEDDIGVPLPDELCARVFASYEACETNGIVTLKPKNPDRLARADDTAMEGLQPEAQAIDDAHKKIQALTKELKQKQQLLDRRTEELRGAQAFLTTTDRHPIADVIRLVEQLNAEIMQVAAAMVDELDVEKIKNVVPLDDGSEVIMRVDRILGVTITKLLRRSGDHLSILVETAFQTCMISYTKRMVSSWSSDAAVIEDILSKIYAQVRETEFQPVSARWKQLTKAALQRMPDHKPDLLPGLVAELGDVLVTAGHEEDIERLKQRITDRFAGRLGTVLKLAQDLNRQIGQGFTSCDLELLYISPDTVFNNKDMEDALQSAGSTRKKERIICTTDLGLGRSERTRASGRKWSVLLKPKVILPSGLEEILGGPMH